MKKTFVSNFFAGISFPAKYEFYVSLLKERIYFIMNVTRAWVWIIGKSSYYKEMRLEDIKTLCKEEDLRIAKNGVIFDVDEYTFTPESEPIRRYCFTIGHYERPPHIDLVPNGTRIENGRYVLPKV